MLKQDLGSHGESLAAEFLVAKGYKITCMNYRCSMGEIDIIATHAEFIIFVEVKTRMGGQVSPLISLTRAKQKRIRKLATWYLSEASEYSLQPRFDVVGISIINDQAEIDHIENAF